MEKCQYTPSLHFEDRKKKIIGPTRKERHIVIASWYMISCFSMEICSLDPGVCTFQTWYSPTRGCGEIGGNNAQKLVRICLALDRLISLTAQAPAKKRNSMRRAQARMRQRIRNLVDEVHKKTALWLVKMFDIIIIPPFNASQIGRKT
ncbi:hypothetical protein G9A89_016945 [Geosiphon pyriformis]|nr:hypothetical protein G9A89_016945 [Geosiphon pyriformis]